ncbi:MAG: hypothetical protein ACK55I_27780 [bacterium]
MHPPLGPHGQEDGRGDGEHVVGVEIEERHRDSFLREWPAAGWTEGIVDGG